VQSDSPRATLAFYALIDGKASPVPTNEEQRPVLGKGKTRVVLTTTSPLAAAPKLAWRFLRGDEDTRHPVTLTGSGTKWEGVLEADFELDVIRAAAFEFEGTSEGGSKGTFIRKGGKVRFDTEGPPAEIVIPDAYKMLVNVKTNKLDAPPVHGGRVAVKLTTREDLARPPKLTYTLDDGKPVPVPMTGFGRSWQGWMDIPVDAPSHNGRFQYEGMDRAGNVTTSIAKRRYPYEDDGNFPIPRKIASYATTGGEFVTDTVAPEQPTNVETEMRKLGIAVIKWKEPPGEPWTYNLYRSLTPISSTEGLKPIKTQIYATIMVDDPPVDGKYYYAVTAIDMAKNESPLSENSSVFIDSIKPELKIKAVPQGDDFVILMDENAPPQLSLTINFPGQKSMRVELGGTSGELEEYTVKTLPSGQRAIVLPQKVGLFNGKVEIVVHSPDPDGNIVEEKTETEYKKIATATGGEVESADEQVQLVIPPGVEPVIPKGPNETKRIGGYENLFFIQYANIPDKKPKTEPGERRRRDQVDPIPPGLEVVGVPYRIELNQPPEEPLQLKAAATQADLSQLKSLTAKLKMKIPTQYSDAVEDVEYLQGRLKVIKWVPARSNEDADKGHWEPVPDIELDVKNKQIITPATDITTYVIVSERTPPSIRDMVPERGGSVTTFRPEISCLIVDKGTGVAVGAENRIVLSIDGKKVDEKLLSISKGDPTEVSVTYKPPEDLKAGTHIVGVRAEDVVENVANVKWQFTIDNEPPEFIRVSPAEGERLPVARPLIQARIEDEGGIAPGRAELSIDGAAIPGSYVTWHEGAGLLTCTLPDDLASGTHQALLVVYDKAGTSAEKAWSFRVDLEPPTVAKLSPAPDSQVAPDTAQVAFRAQDLFGRLEILSFRVDGNRIPMAERKDDTGYRFDPKTGELSYAAPKPFALGDHQVSVLYADDLGNAATRTWSFRSKQGAPAAVAWDQPVKTPEFETVRSSYETVAVRVDTTRLEEYAPQAVEEVSTLVEQAEELAVDSKFEQSAAKYAQAATKLADADNKATEAEHKEVVEANTARLDAAKKAYAASADNAGLERVKKHAPETLSTIGKLVKEADKLAAEGKLEQGRENYYAAAALLDDASKAVEEAERASVAREAAKRLAAAREKYAEAASEVDRGLLEKHTPEALPAATRLVREADDLASEEKLAEAEAKYTQAIATLADASKKADGLEQAAAAAAAAARHEQAKGRYADIAARANRPRVQKHVPDALPAVDELAKEAEALAGANKLDQSAAKFREAADRLLAADTKAEQLERKERFGELAQQHEAAKRKYNELAASANATHIDRHVPGAMAGVRRLVQEAEALAAEQKLAESLQKYTQAQAALAAAQAKAQQLARGDDTAVRARYEAAKKRCTDLAAAVNRERLSKHVPEAAAAVSRLLQQAMALARENRLAESAARYEEITQKLTAADAKAKELERGVATPPGPQPHEAARQKLLDLATKVDTERVSKHVPQAMPQVAELARQAKALAAEGKLAESAAKYTEACDTLTAADAKAQELERAATTATATAGAQLQAAKARYVEVARSVDARRVAKHLPNAFPAVQRLLDEAETLARAGKPQEGAGKYAEATNQLLAAGRKAEQMERAAAAPAVDAQEEFRKARDRYTKLAGSVDAPRITKHLPNVFPTVQRLLNEAGALGQQGKLREGAAKLNQAADLLADSERKAQQLERGPAVAAGDAKQQYESARERYMKVAGSVDAKQIAKHLPDVFPTVRRLLAEAGTLSQAGKLHEGATKLTQAADLLDNAHSRASTMDPVVQEMQVIDTLLKEGKAQEALPRICKPLLDLWTKHRRSRWAELLEWVRQRRETYKPLALTGRNQLDVLEKTLQGYVREERAWTSMQKQLAGLPDLKARIRRVESYLNYNYGSVYYSDGQTLLHTLRVELLRQQEKNK